MTSDFSSKPLFERRASYPPRTPRGFFKRRFTAAGAAHPAAPWYFKFRVAGRQYPIATGCTRIEDARRVARAERMRIETAVRAGAEPRLVRQPTATGVATVGTVCAAYEAWPTAKPRPHVRRQNVDRLRQILREVCRGRDIDQVSTGELTAETVRAFVAAQRARVGATWQRYKGSAARMLDEHSVTMSTASTLRQARSIFSRAALDYFRECGLVIANVSAWMRQHVEQPRRSAPEAPPAEAIAALLASGPELRSQDPAAYVAMLLIAELGLRPVEMVAARETWIHRTAETWTMSIIKRPEENFDPKQTQGHLALDDKVKAELDAFAHLRTDGYLVPGGTGSARRAVIRRLSAWCRRYLPDADKAAYELRRYAGSRVLDATRDPVAAQQFLRHAKLATTMEWYAYRLTRAAALAPAVSIFRASDK